MHGAAEILSAEASKPSVMDFAWVELTNQFNLQCVHWAVLATKRLAEGAIVFVCALVAITSNGAAGAQSVVPPINNDSAVDRAYTYLESPFNHWIILKALHEDAVLKELHYIRSDEAGRGANLTYGYSWSAGGANGGQNYVTFHCDPMGKIDHIVDFDFGSDPGAFAKFTGTLESAKNETVEQLVETWVRPDKEPEGQLRQVALRGAQKLLAAIIASAIPMNGKAVLEWWLEVGYDPANPPSRGVDGFLFGLGLTGAQREFAGTAPEFSLALPGLLARAMTASGLAPRDYSTEAALIAHTAETCAQITADAAFRASDSGGYGREHPAQLGPEFAVCSNPSLLRSAHDMTDMAAPQEGRPLVYTVAPEGKGWKDAVGVRIEVRVRERESDPESNPGEMFEQYGVVLARISEAPVPCQSPPGGGEPRDRMWRQDGTNVWFRIRFECQHAEIYNGGTHDMVADLTLIRNGGDAKKDKYEGTGPFSPCPQGKGKIELDRWSNARVDGKVQFPNTETHECGGLKQGYPLNGIFHIDTQKVVFVPH